jgi:UDP-N-acetylglucosamine acyltransferase
MGIHESAIIDPKAKLGDVEVGPFSVIGADVELEDGVRVGPHCVIHGATTIGSGTVLHSHVVLGDSPQDRKHDLSAKTRLQIGEGNIFREFVSVHRGSSGGRGVTTIGSGNYFMANSHVAHDAAVGSDCLFANSAAIAGHSTVADGAVLSGLCALHQNARIGRLAMVGGGAMCAQDVPPFTIAQGDRARLFGVNVIGLRRAGVERAVIQELKTAWRLLFNSGMSIRVAIGRAKEQFAKTAEVMELIDFIESSQRGVCRAAFSGGSE